MLVVKLVFTLNVTRKQGVIKWSAVRIKHLKYPNGENIFILISYFS